MSAYQSVRSLIPLSDLERIGAAGAKFVVDELSKGQVVPTRQRWLRPQAAAAYVGIDAVTLAQWRSAKPKPDHAVKVGPPYRKIGNRVLYDVADLDKWIASFEKIAGGAL